MSSVPTDSDFAATREWVQGAIEDPVAQSEPSNLPIFFLLDGRDVSDSLMLWEVQRLDKPSREGSRRWDVHIRDPNSGLRIRMEVTVFTDFPAVDWVCYFANEGDSDTGLISNILPLDVGFTHPPEQPCFVHHAKGSDCKLDDFAPQVTELGVPSELRLAPVGGRSSNGTLPFFNLDLGGRGIIGAVGWTGQWKVHFTRNEHGQVFVRAGMERTHLRLHPGEEIRTPRILLLFWEGERLHGHNMLRQLILAHYSPRSNGSVIQAPISWAVWGENLAERQLRKIAWLQDNQIPVDLFWIDAGWHGDAPFREGASVFNTDWWRHVGNWWPNPNTYPEGLGPIGAAAREAGYGFLLWVEAERVYKETSLVREHPDWLLGPVGDNYLLNLGDPVAREGLTEIISSLITEGGITCYRQDFNMAPAPFWEAADAPDRVGISEAKHIEGLYAFWDALLARHPGLFIDNCSSGGRRIDLETISRSIPLWRSDFQCWPGFDPIGIQGQTHGLGLWVPLSTGCCDTPSEYAFRSALGPGMVLTTNLFEPEPNDHFPVQWLRTALQEQIEVRPYFYGDFYPLLGYTLSDESWAAWQFDRPDLGEGMVLVLRRPNSPYSAARFMLHGLRPEALYRLCPKGQKDHVERTGSQLLEEGLEVTIPERPGTALILYRQM